MDFDYKTLLAEVLAKFPETRPFISEKIMAQVFPSTAIGAPGIPYKAPISMAHFYSREQFRERMLGETVIAAGHSIRITPDIINCLPHNKIGAIKEARIVSTKGLKECKDWVQTLVEYLHYS